MWRDAGTQYSLQQPMVSLKFQPNPWMAKKWWIKWLGSYQFWTYYGLVSATHRLSHLTREFWVNFWSCSLTTSWRGRLNIWPIVVYFQELLPIFLSLIRHWSLHPNHWSVRSLHVIHQWQMTTKEEYKQFNINGLHAVLSVKNLFIIQCTATGHRNHHYLC